MRDVLILTCCALLCSSAPGVCASSWTDGRFLPAPWIQETPQTPLEDKVVSLEQGPYDMPLGKDLEELTLWLENAGVSVDNPRNKDAGSMIRRVLMDHLAPRVDGTGTEDVASQKERLKACSMSQIKDLLIRMERNEEVSFNFQPFDLGPVLEKVNSLDIRPTFDFHRTVYALLQVITCDAVPSRRKDLRSVCGKLDVRAWQIVARPQAGSAMAEQGIQRISIRLYQDDDQRFRVYSCLLDVYAPSRVAVLDMISLLNRKYGENVVMKAERLGRQESILQIRDDAGSFPLALRWGKNLLLLCVGDEAASGRKLQVTNERYLLVYADQGATDRFLANLEAVIDHAPLEEIDHRELQRKKVERSF